MTDQKTHQGTDEITYQSPRIPFDVEVHDVPIVRATDDSLRGYGCLVADPESFTVENKRFEIVPWPHAGWRSLDPGTGDEGGTTEGAFRLFWHDGNLLGENLALATTANKYLLGLGALPSRSAMAAAQPRHGDTLSIDHVYVWYSDYHPDGGQLFYSEDSPFVANLAPALGDSIKPEDFTAFYVEAGNGLYIHPGVWHNAVYVKPEHAPTAIFGRQGKVHARISVRWPEEFNKVLRVPLSL
jgi:ureidoglycolate lyase